MLRLLLNPLSVYLIAADLVIFLPDPCKTRALCIQSSSFPGKGHNTNFMYHRKNIYERVFLFWGEASQEKTVQVWVAFSAQWNKDYCLETTMVFGCEERQSEWTRT